MIKRPFRNSDYNKRLLKIIEILGAFHLVKISWISGSAVNGTRFVGSSHWKIPRKSGKSKKVGPFSRLEFPNGISCFIYTFLVICTSSRSTVGHRDVTGLTTKWNNPGTTFYQSEIPRCSHRNFRFFFPNGKRPSISQRGLISRTAANNRAWGLPFP